MHSTYCFVFETKDHGNPWWSQEIYSRASWLNLGESKHAPRRSYWNILLRWLIWMHVTTDGLTESGKTPASVIPAEAGIQLGQVFLLLRTCGSSDL